MSTRKKVYGFLGAAALLTLIAVFAAQFFQSGDAQAADGDSAASAEKADPEATPVELAQVTSGEIASYLSSTANLRAASEVEVVNRTDGQVVVVGAQEGDFVRAGQLLAKFDDTQHRISLQSARQKLAQARLQLEKAAIRRSKAQTQIANSREEYQRYKTLFEEELVSEREVAQLKYQIDELEHDERISDSEIRELDHRVDELQAEIERAQLEISRTEIRAPFAGRITQRSVELGQTFRTLDPLFRLADFDPLYAEVFLSEKDALTVSRGQKVRVGTGADSEEGAQGRVERISPVVDQATGTVKVTIEVPTAGDAFKPGAFVQIDIKTDVHNDALLAPKRAVLEEDGSHYLFVARAGAAKRVPVRLGYQSKGLVELLEGVGLGEQVVVAGQGSLKDGGKIRPIQRDGATR